MVTLTHILHLSHLIQVCQVTFPRGNYFEHEGEPHCEIHYHASRGTLCASCQKPVTGKYT